MATKQEVIRLDEDRKGRRERLADRIGSARETLAPSRLAAKIGEEQKAKVREAGKRAGTFAKDHKYAIGGGVAALAAGAAGLLYWRRSAKSDSADGAPSRRDVSDALESARPIAETQASPAAGSAI